MHHSEVRNHIINKNYYWVYYITIFASFILILFSFYGNILSLLLFWPSIMFIASMLINHYRCRSFCKLYNNYFNYCNGKFEKVLVEEKSYKMSVPYKSYNATIQPPPRATNVVYFETDDFLLLFFSMQHLEIYQLVTRPFIFVKPCKEFEMNIKHVNIIRNFKIAEDQEYRTIIFPNKYGIKKIMIPHSVL